jgi:hypothetical protein
MRKSSHVRSCIYVCSVCRWSKPPPPTTHKAVFTTACMMRKMQLRSCLYITHSILHSLKATVQSVNQTLSAYLNPTCWTMVVERTLDRSPYYIEHYEHLHRILRRPQLAGRCCRLHRHDLLLRHCHTRYWDNRHHWNWYLCELGITHNPHRISWRCHRICCCW